MSAVDANVLVLNLDYQPLNVCNVRRAIVLLGKEKAEILEHNHAIIVSARSRFAAPQNTRE